MQPVSRYMTRLPLTVGPRISVATAHAVMEANGINHLPVVEEHRVIGMLSDARVRLLAARWPLAEIEVREAMTSEPYVVAADTPVREVVETMAKRHVGSAIVLGAGGDAEGIFTTIDAMHVLASLLWTVDADQRDST